MGQSFFFYVGPKWARPHHVPNSAAKQSADRERQALESFVRNELEGEIEEGFQIEPWDWRYIAEKVIYDQSLFNCA